MALRSEEWKAATTAEWRDAQPRPRRVKLWYWNIGMMILTAIWVVLRLVGCTYPDEMVFPLAAYAGWGYWRLHRALGR